MAEHETETKVSKDDNLLRTARLRFATIQTAENDIRQAALEDIRFAYNVEDGQWPDSVRQDRKEFGRPCLTFNKLHKFIAQLSNREREMRLAGRVIPVDSEGDVATALIFDDLIRQIEFQSDADQVYAKGGEQAIAGGFGYWRVLTRYMDDGFDQEIYIEPIENQFSVYLDPRGEYGFIREGMPRAEFTAKYPDAAGTDFEGGGIGEQYALWYEPDKVFVAEYFFKEPVTKEIAQIYNLVNGETSTIELEEELTKEVLEQQGHVVLRTRKVKSHVVRWLKMTGMQILERADWPGKEIPIIRVVGEEINIAGKVYRRSLIRDGKDPQRTYNYWLTSMTETVAMAPDAPYILSAQQIGEHKKMWDDVGKKKRPYILYDAKGNAAAPHRETPPTVPTGAMTMLNIANNDIKDVLGMYEPSLGDVSNERSGRAIFARQERSDVGTFHFPDNLRIAIRATVRILIDLIPKIYNTERIVRLRGAEGKERLEPINQRVLNADLQWVTINDLSVGRYDIREDVRTYSTRRQESADFMLRAAQYLPNVAPLFTDLIFQFQDWPGAKEIAERIKKYMPQLMGQPPNRGTPPIVGETETPPVVETGQP